MARVAENRTRLAAAVDGLNTKIERQTEQLQCRKLEKGIDADRETPANVNYADLWQRYSQGVTARNATQLDGLVARRALADGQSRKAIALMLTAGSSVVKQIHRSYGKKRAMDYVNQTARSICSQQQSSNRLKSSEQQLELE